MLYRDIRFSLKWTLIVISLLGASAAQASLLDCSLNAAGNGLSVAECSSVIESGAEEPVTAVTMDTPSIPAVAAQASFEIDQTRRAGVMSNSVPLLLLIGVFIAFLLLRAKRFNTK